MTLQKKGVVVLDQNFIDQFEILCKLEDKNEWSGLLFYKIEGSLKNPETIVVHPKYVHLMDIGSKTYTEYDMDESALEAFDDYEDAIECRMGHIHSHNSMGVFFSGTDMEELTDNAENHHIYLSIIVNNRSEVEAKIAFKIESEVENKFNYKDLDQSIMTLSSKSVEEKVLVIDLNIEYPEVSNTVNSIINRFQNIKKKKEVKNSQVLYMGNTGWMNKFDNDLPLFNNKQEIVEKDLTVKEIETIYKTLLFIINDGVLIKSDTVISCIIGFDNKYKSFKTSNRKEDFIQSKAIEIFYFCDEFSNTPEISDLALERCVKILTPYSNKDSVRELLLSLGKI